METPLVLEVWELIPLLLSLVLLMMKREVHKFILIPKALE